MVANTRISEHASYKATMAQRLEHSYETHLDGLRAVAVAAVFAYHLSPTDIPGGYLGVDVFFVISGYLITGNLLRDAGSEGISLSRFYARRFKRLLPSFVTLLVTLLLAGWFFLPSYEYRELGKSTLTAAAFAANIYFWQHQNYFAPTAENELLLHLWSLGVEEQFYLIAPVAILFITHSRIINHAGRIFLGALVIASVAAITGSYFLSQDATFYLPWFRAWELLAGAWLATLGRRRLPRSITDTAGAIAIAGLGASFYFVEQLTASHLPAAAIAVFASALLIRFGKDCRVIDGILSLTPMRHLGRLSYPIYLWHWPVILLISWLLPGLSPSGAALTAVVLAYALALATYTLVETPIRATITTKDKTVVCIGCAILATIGLAGGSIFILDGIAQRVDSDAHAARKRALQNRTFSSKCELLPTGESACDFNANHLSTTPEVVVFGDSHALALAQSLSKRARAAGQTIRIVASPECMPALPGSVGGSEKFLCELMREKLQQSLLHSGADQTIIIAARWRAYVRRYGKRLGSTADGESAVHLAISALIERARKHAGQVSFIGPVPEAPWNVARRYAFDSMRSAPASLSAPHPEAPYFFEHFEEPDAAETSNVAFFDPVPAFCNDDECVFSRETELFFYDSHHLSEAGAELALAETVLRGSQKQ